MAIRRGTNATDYLWGTSFADTLYGYEGDDHLYGMDGDDWLYGDGGRDRLLGDWGNDRLYGGADGDWLYGGSGKDYLDGGTGDDLLDGGTGADTMIGGLGSDNYYVDSDLDSTEELAGEGFDTVYASVDHALAANLEMLVLTGTAEIGVGNNLDNDIIGNAMDNYLSGGDGRDHLYGGAGADWMLGGRGDDWFFVDNADDDALEGVGQGHDTVSSSINWTLSNEEELEDLFLAWGSGAVTAIGNDLDNLIGGNERDNLLMGGGGNDDLDGDDGADTMWGGRGDDEYWFDNAGDSAQEFFGEGFDTVWSSVDTVLGANIEMLRLLGGAVDGTGNGLANGIFGTESQNLLRGGGGNDALRGNGGNDFLHGEAGIDQLWGGMGADVMSGGSEADFFNFDSASETVGFDPFGPIYDRITDFSSVQGDKIILSAIDANGDAAGSPDFSFIGGSAFHGIAGELRFADHFLQGDTNGDRVADFQIQLNVATLSASDIWL